MQKWAKFSKRYSKIDPQMLLKKWSLNVTQKLTQRRYSKIDPQALRKNWPTTVTQNWRTTVTLQLTHNSYSKSDPQACFICCAIVNFFLHICVFVTLSFCYRFVKFFLIFRFGFFNLLCCLFNIQILHLK